MINILPKNLLFSLGFLLMGITTVAQDNITVKGTVSGSGGVIPGVNIIVRGTDNGSVTDFDGNYTISNVAPDAVIVFSYLGFKTVEIPVNNQTVINVDLEEDSAELEQVVLVGYGSVAKKDVTGAISTLQAKDFNAGAISSPEQLIQGRTPGVQITSDGGEPGGSVNVRVRGTSSVRSGNGPLYVVNGVPLNGIGVSPTGANVGSNDNGLGNTTAKNPLSFINPNDIANIAILKDASATAIYGSRGANGVIMITTKKGKSGSGALTYTTSVSASTITEKLDLLDADEFRTFVDPALDFGSSTDWQDVIFRTALSKNHYLSYGGGSDDGKSIYHLSAGTTDQEGIVEGSGMKMYTGTINTSYKLFNDRLNIKAFAAGTNILDQNPQISNDAGFTGDILSGAWRANPTRPIYNADGTFAQPDINERNPAAILGLTTDRTNTFRVLGDFSAELELMKGLSYKLNFGVDRSNSERQSALSGDLNVARVAGLGIASVSTVFSSNLLLEHTLNYKKEFGDIHSINALAGYSYQSFKVKGRTFSATNFQSTDLNVMLNNLESAQYSIGGTASAGSIATKDEIQSYFGRINYTLMDKYILTGTLRADGSSKFGENNRYGYFPSVAFAWRLSDEEFIPDSFSDLKLRLGYGITGNQEFDGGSQIVLQRFDSNNNLSAPRFGNPDLKWESTTQYNAGIDFGFFDGRLRGSIDFYDKITKDLLLRLDTAEPAPASFFFGNLDAEVQNTGLEFNIEGDIIESEDFNWTTNFNISFNKNEVTKIDRRIQTGAISGQGLTGAFVQVITQGEPLYSYFLSEFKGFDSDGASIEEPARLIGKSPLPDYTFGFTNTLNYKNWDLSLFFAGQIGGYIYNNNRNALFLKGSLINGGKNVTRDVANSNESPTNGNNVSTRFLEDGSFVRLQNMVLGYTFNTDKLKYLDDLRISVTGQNLLTFTDYSGQDPEVNVDKSIGGVPSLGIDYSAYPRARTFTLGLTMSFK
ncbi:SusC/RagA family TonB-linked outer membrane protein [Aquimarina sediminis]|uniref:SusC/RagA family TonB-linked outer membrane protein n=1 Tax=Aquimarina sediminis TaxID=2070536 RepID=UPI0019D42335|nr:TonB-dependent receptor [Aquimarina sediminis]